MFHTAATSALALILAGPHSTIDGLAGLEPGPAAANCVLPAVSGPISVTADTHLPGSAIDWASLVLDHSTLTWRWSNTLTVIPPPPPGAPAYVFVLNGRELRYAAILDVNLDGFVDGHDYDDFFAWFDRGDQRADFNGDGFVDGIDSDIFNNEWTPGG